MEHFNAKEDKSLSKINGKALQLKTGGGLTLGDQEILKNNHRLEFIWGEHNENSTTQETPVTTWRQARARRAYRAIQDANGHLFLAVALAITPTECAKTSFENTLDYLTKLESYEPYHLELNSAAKRFFESTAAEQGFAGNHRYLTFMQSLFPQSLSYTSSMDDLKTDFQTGQELRRELEHSLRIRFTRCC